MAACGGESPAAPVVVASIQVTAATDTLRALGATAQLTASALDAQGNPVSGKTFTWTSSAPGVATINTAGQATAVGNGTANLTATVDGKTGQVTLAVAQDVASVTVTPGTPTLTALNQTQAFTAVARDANSATVTGIKFLWISNDPGVATVDTNGVASARGAGQAVITAAARGIPGNAVITVSPTAQQLFVSVQPGATVAGSGINPAVEVEIRDAGGSVVKSARNAVTIAFSANPGGGVLSGTTTVSANSGIASFSGLTITKAAAGYILAVSASGVTGTTTGAFNVMPGPAVRLAFVPNVNPIDTAGVPLGVSVAVQDAFGNTVTGAAGTVTLSMGANVPGATFYGTAVTNQATVGRTLSLGVASFSDIKLHLPGVGYSLQATATGLDPAQSLFFQVRHAPPFRLQIESHPFTHSAGTAMTPPVVSVRDSVGNLTTTVDTAVTVSLVRDAWVLLGTPKAPLLGTTTVATINGQATFFDLGVGKPSGAGRYFLAYSAPSIIPDTINAGLEVTLFTIAPLAAGGSHTCTAAGLGKIYCFGSDSTSQLGHPTGSTLSDTVGAEVTGAPFLGYALSAGAGHTCALGFSSYAYCWGDNSDGQLGNNQQGTNSSIPVTASGNRAFMALSAGAFHTCAIDTGDSSAWCWGRNTNGQLGNGGTTTSAVPVQVLGGLQFISIAAGGSHTCAITAAGAAYCWGLNTNGQLGDSTNTQRTSPQLVRGAGKLHVAITAGLEHTCTVADTSLNKRLFCWGSNSDGQLGLGSTGGTRTYPSQLTAATELAYFDMNFSAGDRHTCVLSDTSGAVYCWGDNQYGQAGAGAPSDITAPTAINFGLLNQGWLGLAAGSAHSCVRSQTPPIFGNMYCWGRNHVGQLGDATQVDRSQPTQIKQ